MGAGQGFLGSLAGGVGGLLAGQQIGGCGIGKLDVAGGHRVQEGAGAATFRGEKGLGILALGVVEVDGAVV